MKNIVKVGIIATAVLLLMSCGSRPLPKLSVSGKDFVTPKGKVVVLRGLATSDPYKLYEDGHWNDEYFAMAQEWGANVVRFPIHSTLLEQCGWEQYFELLDEGLEMAAAHRLYVIIDWHGIGNLFTEITADPFYSASQELASFFWKTVAERYKGNSTIAGYELFNEPTTGDYGELGACTWHDWKCLMEEYIDEIRAIDPDAICMVGGLDWAFDLHEAGADPVLRENVAYVSHPYPAKAAKPWPENWEYMFGYMADTYPVVCTEVGFIPMSVWSGGPCGTDDPYGEILTEYFESKGISFTAWCFDPEWGPNLISDWDYNTTISGEAFKSYLQGLKHRK